MSEPIEQPTLFGDVEIQGLGRAQQRVLAELRERGELYEDEAGAILHSARGKHSEDVRCVYCGRDGKDVLASLRRHKLVRQVRASGVWVLPGSRVQSGPGPGDLPEGF